MPNHTVRLIKSREKQSTALKRLLALVTLLGLTYAPGFGQSVTQKYAIDVAGIKIGVSTATRTVTPSGILFTQISDVEFWFFGKIKIYYKTVAQHHRNEGPVPVQLLHSNVDATTTKGNFKSEVVWNRDHYDINVNQYKYTRKTTDATPVDFTISRMYFEEPVGRKRIFSEYFGDYATIEPTKKGSYLVKINDREDEYFYEKGKLTKVVKKNPIKNFVIRLED